MLLGRLGVQRQGDADHARAAVDGEAPACAVEQAVGDRVVADVGVLRQRRESDPCADRHILGQHLRCGVRVGDRAHIGLVHIRHRHGPGLRLCATIAGECPHHDGVALRGFGVQPTGDREHAGGGVDGEAPAGIVEQ